MAGAWDVVGRKVSKTQILTDIYETARTSIGLPLPLDAPAIRMFRMVVAEARSLIRQRNEIETQADELLRHSPDYHLLRQIPGIGPINALTIIAEAGDLRRFNHHRQFLKFCPPEFARHQKGPPERNRHRAHRDCAPVLIRADAITANGPARDMLVKFVRRLGPAAILQAVVTATELGRFGRVDS